MKFHIIFVGKTTESYLAEGIEEYIGRISRYVSINTETVKSAVSKDTKRALEEEERSIMSRLLPGDLVIVLDEGGDEFGSRKLADRIQKWMEQGRSRIVFITGGAFGVSPSIKTRADHILSLSKLTFTHQMVRLFFCEQLYRSMTIIRNEKYHHE